MNQIQPFLWGKLGGGIYPVDAHPVVCHLVDVGNVALQLWTRCLHPGFQSWMADELELSITEAGRYIAYWIALHDLGKISPAFQQKSLAARKYLESLQFEFRVSGKSASHGDITAVVLPGLLFSQTGLPEKHMGNRIAQAVAGHHGLFVDAGTRRNISRNDRELGSAHWCHARDDASLLIGHAFNASIRSDWSPREPSTAFLMALAGLTTVSDWIGSMTEHFRPAGVEFQWEEYVTRSREISASIVDELGWTGWEPPVASKTLAELFPFITTGHERPLQVAVANLTSRLNEPSLVVIEAPMGEGKTEAAMLLADHWAARCQQRGIYFALPTMATSNQMFGRVREFLTHRYPEQKVNLLLLHGRASLSEALRELLNSAEGRQPENVGGSSDSQENLFASEWFTYRKRGLLAPFGVGTIDQALMAVLQTKHVFVRLFSLARKTIIIDEVHAYDMYMTSLLESLLSWLRELGASVVLLSATLPKGRRERLYQAWGERESLRDEATLPATTTPYPRITWYADGCVCEQSIDVAVDRKSTIAIRWFVPDVVAWGSEVAIALQDGGCAAVICNTVQQAQDVYRALGPYFAPSELDLFHARFPFEEREVRERRCLNSFGKHDGAGRSTVDRIRQRKVLVATQVIEQSLDLDFDLMVLVGLAPADLCLQRAGRLHRHQRARPPRLTQPELWITETPLDDDQLPDFESNGYVYSPHILLRTLLTLRDREQITLPDDMEELVESVYDDKRPMPDGLPASWQRLWDSTWKDLSKQREEDAQEAGQRLIKLPTFRGDLAELTRFALAEDDPSVNQAMRALTRLTRPNVTVVCLHESTEGIRLSIGGELVDIESEEVAKSSRWIEAFIRRSVTISRWSIVEELTQRGRVPKAWERSPMLRQHHVLRFDENGNVVDFPLEIYIDPELGLCIGSKNGDASQCVIMTP